MEADASVHCPAIPLHEREWHQTGDGTGVFDDESYAIAFCRNEQIAKRIVADHEFRDALAGIRNPAEWRRKHERLRVAARAVCGLISESKGSEIERRAARAFVAAVLALEPQNDD